MIEFQKTLVQQLERVQPSAAAAELPLEVWAMDESRFGLQTVRRRRLTLRGIKPVGRYQHEYQNFYVYGAVAPRTGDGFFQARLTLNGAQFQAFLHDFARAHPESFNVLILDNARAHRFSTLTLPANMALLFQPPYTPELNPCERVWLALKDGLAWACFSDLLALQARIAARIEGYDSAAFRSLIAYPYLIRAAQALAAERIGMVP